MTVQTVRLAIWSLVGVALVAATFAFFFIGAPSPTGGASLGRGDYVLAAADNHPVTEVSFQGRPSMVFFGYTHCPDVCPTTLAEMAGWLEQLGSDGEALQAFFISVDPERDTPDLVGNYAGAVSDRITGVSGTPAEVEKALRAWRIYSKKVPAADGDYTMDHTASVILVNSGGGFEGTIAFGESNARRAGKAEATGNNLGRQQVGTSGARQFEAFGLTPRRDLGVIAAEQHRRNRPIFPDCGPRVLRIFEQIVPRSFPRLDFRRRRAPRGSSRTTASSRTIAATSPPAST